MSVRGYNGHIQDPTSAQIRFPESHGTTSEESRFLGPLNAIETSTCRPKAFEPDFERIFTGSDTVGELGNEELFEFFVRACANQSCHESSGGGA